MSKILRLVRYGRIATDGIKSGFEFGSKPETEFTLKGMPMVVAFASSDKEMKDAVAIFEVIEG